jgi:hypothetical protein
MTETDVVIFTSETSWDSLNSFEETYTTYENLYIFKRKDKKGYGFRYEVPYSDLTLDVNEWEEFKNDVDWDYFSRMHLITEMRDLLGGFEPKEEE